MIKTFQIVFSTLTFFFYTFNAIAGIRFIMDTPASSEYNTNKDNSSPDTQNLCIQDGYTKTNCEEGFVLTNSCPYLSNYFADCCPEEYRYTKEECKSQNKTSGTYSCGGYYKCI